VTVTLTVTTVNDAPVGADDHYSVAEDASLSGTTVLANDSDLHGGAPDENNIPFTARLVTEVSHGVLALSPNGRSPTRRRPTSTGRTARLQGADSKGAESETATVTITVTSANDNPVASDDEFTVDSGRATPLDVTANDSDLKGGAPDENNLPLRVSVVGNVSHGLLVINADGSAVYTSTEHYVGEDRFTYRAVDTKAGSPTSWA